MLHRVVILILIIVINIIIILMKNFLIKRIIAKIYFSEIISIEGIIVVMIANLEIVKEGKKRNIV